MQELAAILVFRAFAWSDAGALADAVADARWTLERAQGAHRMHAVSELIRVLIERDALDAAEQELEQFPDPCGSRSDEVVRFLMARGRLRSAQGRLEDALDDFLECGQRCASLGRVKLSAVPWRAEAGVVHAALGNLGDARRLAQEQLSLARAFGRSSDIGCLAASRRAHRRRRHRSCPAR
jgi:tetratricopeptide (TPR) repeat protein